MTTKRFSLVVAALSLAALAACDDTDPVAPAAAPGSAPTRDVIATSALPVSNHINYRGMMIWEDVQIPVAAGQAVMVRVSGPIHVQKDPAYQTLCQSVNMCQDTGYPGGDVGPAGWNLQLRVAARVRVGAMTYNIPLQVVAGDSMTVTGTVQAPADGVLELWREHMGHALTVSNDQTGYYAEANEYTFSSSQQVVVSTGPSLSCLPATVTRGQTVRCELSDMTGVSMSGWEWKGEMYVNDPSLRVTESSSAGFWQGPALDGGTVTASFYFNGTYQTASSSFAVIDRTAGWQWGPGNWKYNPGGAPLCTNTRPAPGPGIHIGWNRNAGIALNKCGDATYNRWILPDPTLNPSAGYTAAAAPSGPNRNRWYVTAATYRIDRASNVNPQWLAGGTTYSLKGAQATLCVNAGVPSPVSVNLYVFNETCKGHDVDALIAAAWGHEGFGYNGGTGHQGVAQGAAAQTDNDPYYILEHLTAASSTALNGMANNLVDAASQRISAQTADPTTPGGATNVTGNWPGGPMWLWDAGPKLYVSTNIPAF